MDYQHKVERSQAWFTSFNLSFYDAIVAFVSPQAWRCPIPYLDNHYEKHLSNNHLEVGPGTGFLLNRAKFPANDPRLVLMDFSQDCLDKSSTRLARYQPQTCRQNILEPVNHDLPKFDSMAINYVFHCVPGDFKHKGVAFAHLKTQLNPGAKVFGCTVLGEGVKKNWLAKAAMGLLQGLGIFHNQQDNVDDLRRALEDHFVDVEIEVRGPTAVFSARNARD